MTGLLRFSLHSFPIAASLMSERALLGPWRAGLAERVVGPHQPVEQVARHLEAERAAGRVPKDVDPMALAELLCGAALQQAFFANFADNLEFAEAPEIARLLMAALRLV